MKLNNLKFCSAFFAVFLFGTVFLVANPVMAAVDTDGDGLSDQEEIEIYYTDINNIDTDGDGYDDYTEVYNGYSPHNSEPVKLATIDSDGDQMPDSWEIRLGLNILDSDSDGDGYDDYTEIINGYNPKSEEPEMLEKLIEVDLETQTLAYYFGGTQLEKFLISGGVDSMPTPTGEFVVLDKVPSKNYGGTGFNFAYPDTKWNLHFTTDYWRYYIHGAYWHNNFGHPMSHGCVNVAYPQMERLYNFSQVGTKIKIS